MIGWGLACALAVLWCVGMFSVGLSDTRVVSLEEAQQVFGGGHDVYSSTWDDCVYANSCWGWSTECAYWLCLDCPMQENNELDYGHRLEKDLDPEDCPAGDVDGDCNGFLGFCYCTGPLELGIGYCGTYIPIDVWGTLSG